MSMSGGHAVPVVRVRGPYSACGACQGAMQCLRWGCGRARWQLHHNPTHGNNCLDNNCMETKIIPKPKNLVEF